MPRIFETSLRQDLASPANPQFSNALANSFSSGAGANVAHGVKVFAMR